jgi:pyruvate/2-oxoglutarate dehydrogenase complex dihydrolipoamide dehydrogenase (E3) component
MSEREHYEILVIGSGEAGKHLTWNLAQAGHRTAVVERKYILADRALTLRACPART